MPDYKITEVDDFADADFDFLWNQCKDDFQINFPFHLWARYQTERERHDFILEQFRICLAKEGGLVWKSTLDGLLVAMHAGAIDADAKLLHWDLALIGYDSKGKHSWFRLPEAVTEKEAFWSRIGVDAWRMTVLEDDKNKIKKHLDQYKAEISDGGMVKRPHKHAGNDPRIKDLKHIDFGRRSKPVK